MYIENFERGAETLMIVGGSRSLVVATIASMADQVQETAAQIYDERHEMMKELERLLYEVSDVVEGCIITVINKFKELFSLILLREDSKAKQAIRIYQQTKNKRIKRKKFKELVGYLIDEMAV